MGVNLHDFYGMKDSEIHIGRIVKTVFDDSGISIAEFARRIHRDRSTVYSLFDRASIDTDMLAKISLALNHNFFTEIMQFYGLDNTPSSSFTVHIDSLSPDLARQFSAFLATANKR